MPVLADRDVEEIVVAEAAAKVLEKKRAKKAQAYDPALGATLDEVEARLAAMRADLGQYGEYVHELAPARHHQAWIDLIMQLIEGRLPGGKRKLLILAPPNSAKSTWLSLIFPPWYLGNHPDQSLLFLTSSDIMAGHFSTTVRATLQQNERHALVFPDLACRPAIKRGWSSEGLYLYGAPSSSKDPTYRAVGYGARVVGARADGIILDDPLDQVAARSETEAKKALEYLKMTLERRLQPEGWMLMITTRWSEFDLPAHVIDRSDWHVVTFPMIALAPGPGRAADPMGRAPGELLWPERFPQEIVDGLLQSGEMTRAEFNAVYQADISGLGGEVFKDSKWFQPLPSDFFEPREDGLSMRDRLTVVQAWDLAFSEKETAAYTSCVTLGVDSRYNIYVLNVYREKLSPQGTEDAIVRLYRVWKPRIVAIEEAAFKAQVTKELVRKLLSRGIGNIQVVRPTQDKVARARLPAARAEAGLVFADQRPEATWWSDFLAECLGFPLTQYKDQVDAFALATQTVFERPIQRPKKVRISPYGTRRTMVRIAA